MSQKQEFDELRKRRIAAKGWVSRTVKKLEELLAGKEELDHELLLAARVDCEKRLGTVDEVQSQIELCFSTEAEMLEDIECAATWRESVTAVLCKASKALSCKDLTGSSQSQSDNLKLPKLVLPKFDGDVLKWQSFWECFEASVDRSEMPEVTKFAYLRSFLKGDALDCISGLPLTAVNYSGACKLLKNRFGRKEVLTFSHIQQLLSVPEVKSGSVSSLREFQDRLLIQIRSLESLDIGGDKYGVILVPFILSKLPSDIRLEWAREGSGREADLAWLMDFLSSEIERRERTTAYGSMQVTSGQVSSAEERHTKATSGPQHRRKRDVQHRTPSGAALQTSGGRPVCGFCEQSHLAEVCPKLKPLTFAERRDSIRQAGLCFKCLKPGHVARRCDATCSGCRGHHNAVCCLKLHGGTGAHSGEEPTGGISQGSSNSNPAQCPSLSCKSVGLGKQCTVLPTARVVVMGRGGQRVEATALFDTGSDRTYVCDKLVKCADPVWVGSENVSYAAFGGTGSSVKHRDVYRVDMFGSNMASPSPLSVNAICVPVICAPLQRPVFPAGVLQSFSHLELADPPSDRQLTVDILVGLDCYWDLMKQGEIRLSGGPVAQETALGWVISGKVSAPGGASGTGGATSLLCLGDIHEQSLRRLWSLEGIGVREPEEGDSEVLARFDASVVRADGRYEVALPWKADGADKLQENRSTAEARLSGLSRRLARDPELGAAYSEALQEMEQAGVVEEVPSHELDGPHPRFYLPHRPVVKESSVSTRVRPVFDASAPGPNGVSLNDCLEVGPCLIPSLVDVLLRFRRWRVAVTADISKAFLQVGLRKEDRDVHRFLWLHEGRKRVMRFRGVTFGVSSSPFLLNATIRHHLAAYPPSRAITEMSDNFYVDDLLSGADSEQEASSLLSEAQAVMSDAGMTLTKYKSNSLVVFDRAHAASVSGEPESVKVLGVSWSPDEDAFSFEGLKLPTDVSPTKRVVLSCVARLFDPLGFLSPFTMVAKSIFQELWQLGLGWDDELPEDRSLMFMDWLRGLELLKQVRIPRCYSTGGWCHGAGVSIHAFGDASPKGYGAAVYLRTSQADGSSEVTLVMAKARLAPLKKVTLPRLELLGSLLAARLAVLVWQALRLPDDTATRCWTDSMIALGWIRGEPQRWKQFVANRVTEIQSLTAPSDWSHCPGEENPADLTTRGVSAECLIGSELWFGGPSWLSSPQAQPGADESALVESGDDLPEAARPARDRDDADVWAGEKAGLPCLVTAVQGGAVFDCSRWSSLTKAVRVVAWVSRFCRNAQSARQNRSAGELSAEEIASARHLLLREAQRQDFAAEFSALEQGKSVPKSSSVYRLTPFIGEDGLLRIRGRLQQSELTSEERHPVLLPKGWVAELLVRDQHRLMSHCGVSTLITAVRAAYRIVGKRSCLTCQRQDAAQCNEPAAPVPKDRVTRAEPFSVTGVDFAGPIFAVDHPRQKLYVCLFTCAVTRAVHLELTGSLSQADFLMALRRFAARRGLPAVIYSDNARTFSGADLLMQRYFGHLAPRWKFIVPRSPWWGGWWERLVRSVKVGLRKSLGTRCLARVELETVLTEVESCVNSRPLTQVTDSVDSENPLTPSHFLMGRGAGFQARVLEDPEAVSGRALSERARVRERRLNRFWSVWRDEYLRNLPQSVRKFSSHGKLGLGSVVLVREDNTPRMKWVMGTVTKLYPGRDGVTRSAEVRTQGGQLRTRAVQRLCDLELLD